MYVLTTSILLHTAEAFVSKDKIFDPIDCSYYAITVGPILEEVIFRGCLNNGIYLGQQLLEKAAPESLRGRLFNYIISPSPRLLIVHGLFSFAHGIQRGSILFLLGASFTLLHESTGDIIAPIYAHITQNALIGIGRIFAYTIANCVS